jgi:hypothetical protein
VQLRRARAAGARLLAGACWLVDIVVHHAFSVEEDMVEVRQNPFLLRTILLCGEFVLACRACLALMCTDVCGHFASRLRPAILSFFLMDAYFLQSMILLRQVKRG